MSYESTSGDRSGPLSAILSILGWHRAKPAEFAHPWTAYCPTRFKPCETARAGIVAEKLEQAAQNKAVDVTTVEAVAAPTQEADDDAAEKATQPVKLRLVSSNDPTKATRNPVLPALATATGRDFQLSARLGTVSALNRRVAPAARLKTDQKTGLNRPVKQIIEAKRVRTIEPPAVGRKTRKSAEIVKLQLTLARAERKRAKVLKIA